jgi:hypothetical protein
MSDDDSLLSSIRSMRLQQQHGRGGVHGGRLGRGARHSSVGGGAAGAMVSLQGQGDVFDVINLRWGCLQ